jgi:hypothetical protein
MEADWVDNFEINRTEDANFLNKISLGEETEI